MGMKPVVLQSLSRMTFGLVVFDVLFVCLLSMLAGTADAAVAADSTAPILYKKCMISCA